MSFFSARRARYELLILLLLALSTTSVFWFSDLDIAVSSWLYLPDNAAGPWPFKQWWLVKILFEYAFPFTVISGFAALLVYMGGFLNAFVRRFRRQALYVLLVIAVGPGLMVNLVFKDHWGRPRPVHIKEFGGEYQYIPPVQIGDTPDKSFVCGHCSVGYAFFALYFLASHYKLLYLLLVLGLAWVMGFTRMVSGGHFLSDVLWSGYVVFLVAYVLYYGWYLNKKG